METLYGNIWRLAGPTDFVVIPTNIGWRKGTAQGIMGAGLAAQARSRWPTAEGSWGAHCVRCINERGSRGIVPPLLLLTGELPIGIILLPTKPLNFREPHRSWQGPADPELIKHGLRHILAEAHTEILTLLHKTYRVLVPLLGAGHGSMAEAESKRIIEQEVAEAPHRARYFLVQRGPACVLSPE